MADFWKDVQQATARAMELCKAGDYAAAWPLYLTAADNMRLYAKTLDGASRLQAQEAARQLIERAEKVKSKAPKAPQPVKRKENAEKPAANAQTERPSNRSSIERDIRQYQNTGRNGTGANAEDRMKFSPVASPNVRFSDIAGLDDVKKLIRMRVIEPILHPEIYERFSKAANGGILLYGPPGTGKTMIARAIATETGLDFFDIKCSDIVGAHFGDGERNLRALFDTARASEKAIIFFDEFESLACKRGGNSTVMNRIVPELLSQMDGFRKAEGQLIVLASTNRPWDLDSAVLRPPRMTERIYVGLPDFAARHYLLMHSLDPIPKAEAIDYDALASQTEGYNCSDIAELIEKIKEEAIQRGLETGNFHEYIRPEDVQTAVSRSHSSVQVSDLQAFSKWEATQG